MATGYPIYIYDTQVGGGVTSINNSDSEVVGIGTTCVDNIYYISEWTYSSLNARYSVGILTCNIDSILILAVLLVPEIHPIQLENIHGVDCPEEQDLQVQYLLVLLEILFLDFPYPTFKEEVELI